MPTTGRKATRIYQSAVNSRLTSGWGLSNTSADSELISSLRILRSRSRALVRDAAYAKRAKTIIQNNIIGAGIGMQAQIKTTRGDLSKQNKDLESAWTTWSRSENCHTGGQLHFSDLERLLMGEIFEAGEVLVRKHYRPFGRSGVPFALEVIEAERLSEDLQPGPGSPVNRIRMGVECDEYYRPVAYYIRRIHPGELRLSPFDVDRLERVPADQIIHLKIVDRFPQTRGVPWLHAVARKLNDMDGYSEAEIIAARGAASYLATIETEGDAGGDQAEGESPEMTLEPGTVRKLDPGDKFNFHTPNRPNPAMDPFMRMMLREFAAGANISYESVSRDYSQSNFSSSRLSLLDDRDVWKVLQAWFIREFREPIHREWLQMAVLAKQIPSISAEQMFSDLERITAVRFKPRGWSWVDPAKEVSAYKEAVKSGFTTTTDVIAQTANGRDIEDILEERRQELDAMEELDLVFDTDPELLTKETEPATAGGEPKPGSQEDPEDPEDEEEKKNAGTGQDDKGRKLIPIISSRTRRDRRK